ncbi:unnamed protein product [Effrenium voratum]|nr:unnamed protein product [Effrenium voratum]
MPLDWDVLHWPIATRSASFSFLEHDVVLKTGPPKLAAGGAAKAALATPEVETRGFGFGAKPTVPWKSGTLKAMSKRFGLMGPYGASLRRPKTPHHGVGLVASGAGPDSHPTSYSGGYGGGYGSGGSGYGGGYDSSYGGGGYGGGGYGESYGGGYDSGSGGGYGDPYGGGYGDGYDSHGYGGDPYDPYGPPPDGYPPEPQGEEEKIAEEQMLEDEELDKCMAKCPVWDPLSDAKPEDLQHASLVMLQRRARPEHRLAPGLRKAAAAVDLAGRDFERWVRKRQELGRELPKFKKIMKECKIAEDERDAEEVNNDVEAIKEETDRARKAAKANEDRLELDKQDEVSQNMGHMQGKVDSYAMEQELQHQDMVDAQTNAQTNQAINNYNQQGGDLQQRQMEEIHKEMPSAMLESKDSGGAKVATSMSLAGDLHLDEAANPQPHHLDHHGHHYGPSHSEHCDEFGCYDEYGGYWDESSGGYYDENGQYWDEGMKSYWDQEGGYYKKNTDNNDELNGYVEWFKKCGQIRVPASIIASRRAASEAYWTFDRSLAVAEKAVSDALTSARLKGE